MAAFLNVCRFNPTAGGTTDWTYSSAVTGYQSPAAANVVNGRLYKYRAESIDLSQWELGEGAYNTSSGVLARTTVLSNSSGTTSKINFATVPQVAIVALKEDLISIEEANGFTAVQRSQARANISAPLNGHLFGLTLSAAGGTGTFGIAAGECADSTAADLMVLASAYTKTTGNWAVGSGNGGVVSGALAGNTWYHVWVIKRPDTGVVDVICDLASSATPALPTNYTIFRRIGSMKTNGSSQWIKFAQVGDEFIWDAPAVDANNTTQSTAAVLYTLSVPPGVKIMAHIRGYFCSGSSASFILISSPDEASTTPTSPAGNATMTNMSTTTAQAYTTYVMTNTSGQIRAIATVLLNLSFAIATHGWTDRRGRDG